MLSNLFKPADKRTPQEKVDWIVSFVVIGIVR